MDSLAVCYAGELARWGIEPTIVVPGAFTSGTNHFAHAGSPGDGARQKQYDDGPYAGLAEALNRGMARVIPADADAADVARAIVEVVGRSDACSS